VVEDGATIALGGLIQNSQVEVVKKVPILGDWLGDLPIIGLLFRSKKFERGETELVILITPRVVRAGERVARDEVLAPPKPAVVEPAKPAAPGVRGVGK